MEKKSQPRTQRTIRKEIEIAAPIEAVWKALTEAAELARWFPLEARVEPGAGGTIYLSWGPPWEGTAQIDVWEPNQRFRWVEPSQFAKQHPAFATMAVEWVLEARGGKTLLRLVNSGFLDEGADWENEYHDSMNYGWGFMLTNLRHYLERHAGTTRLVAWARKKVAVSREAAFERLARAGGLFIEDARTALREGERHALHAAWGEAFTGKVKFIRPPRGFCVTVDSLNDALLWLSLEGSTGQLEAQLWLSAYGLPAAQVEAFEARWKNRLEEIFAEA